MRRIWADIGETPRRYGNLPVKDFTRLDIHKLAAANDKIGLFAPCGHGDQTGGRFGP
jgi:hypothetical protein